MFRLAGCIVLAAIPVWAGDVRVNVQFTPSARWWRIPLTLTFGIRRRCPLRSSKLRGTGIH